MTAREFTIIQDSMDRMTADDLKSWMRTLGDIRALPEVTA